MSKPQAGKVIEELKRRVNKQAFTPEDHCFPKQLDFINDKAKFKTAVCSRRAGKSVACAIDLLYTALNMKGDVAYITLNRRSAKRIIWRTLLELIEKYSIECKLDNTELTITLANKNVIHISGAKDESDIEKLRGLSFRKVYIDECQSFRSYLETLIEDILEPALTDYDGSLILIGTPGPVLAGYFYTASQSKGWSHHHWTLHDNPWILSKSGKTADTLIEEMCKRRGVSKDDPSVLREYYGKWVKDYDSLVYKFDKARNLSENKPDDLSYVFGVDIGWIDADAIAVMGYSPSEKHVYLVEEIVTDKQTITSLAEQLRELELKYKPVKMVMDAGALGKKIQEEIRQRHQIQIHAAEKTRKLEFIELLNDDLRTSKFKVYPGSRFEEDSYLVQWDREIPGKPKISDTYHTDIGDAVLYAWRECRHFLYEKPKELLVPGTDKYMDHLEEVEAEKLMEKLKKQREYEQEVEGWIDGIDPYED